MTRRVGCLLLLLLLLLGALVPRALGSAAYIGAKTITDEKQTWAEKDADSADVKSADAAPAPSQNATDEKPVYQEADVKVEEPAATKSKPPASKSPTPSFRFGQGVSELLNFAPLPPLPPVSDLPDLLEEMGVPKPPLVAKIEADIAKREGAAPAPTHCMHLLDPRYACAMLSLDSISRPELTNARACRRRFHGRTATQRVSHVEDFAELVLVAQMPFYPEEHKHAGRVNILLLETAISNLRH